MYIVKVMRFSTPVFRCMIRHGRFRVLILRLDLTDFRVQNVWFRDVSLVCVPFCSWTIHTGLYRFRGGCDSVNELKCSKLNRACLQPLSSLLVR